MAKLQIKSEKITPFGGIFQIMEHFNILLRETIDSTLGLRCTSYGYQYSEILRSMMTSLWEGENTYRCMFQNYSRSRRKSTV